MSDKDTSLEALKKAVQTFVNEREWKKYHNPKDLAESISIEAAELLQLFQWVKSEESEQFKNHPSKLQRIKEELADVLIYSLSIANTFNIDMTTATLDKLEENRKKYPREQYRGKARLNP